MKLCYSLELQSKTEDTTGHIFLLFFYIIAFLYQNIKVKNNNHLVSHIKAQLFCQKRDFIHLSLTVFDRHHEMIRSVRVLKSKLGIKNIKIKYKNIFKLAMSKESHKNNTKKYSKQIPNTIFLPFPSMKQIFG